MRLQEFVNRMHTTQLPVCRYDEWLQRGMCPQPNHSKNRQIIHIYLLEYITYPGTSTINLNFWLSWFLDTVSEAGVTRGHGFKSQPPLIKVEYSAPGMTAYVASTLLVQRTLV